MAMIQCSECKKDISSQAEKCPSCGAPVPKSLGQQNVGCCSGCILIGLAIVFIPSIVMQMKNPPEERQSSPSISAARQPVESERLKIAKVGETVTIGYSSYCVWKSWWDNKTSDNEFINQKPNASFLFIDLTVRNNDKKARTVPPFKLIDEDNNEYDEASNAFTVKDAFNILEDLNPSVSKRGVILFDVPKGRDYRLKVSGGYWSGEDALIQIK